MTEQEFKELLKKYENGTATPSEVHDVEAFYNIFLNEALDENLPVIGDAEDRKVRLLEKVHRMHRDAPTWRRKVHGMTWRVAASVALFLTVATGISYWQKEAPALEQVIAADVAPGGDKAILQLSDNSIMTLDSLNHRTVLQQGGALVTSTSGQLVYAKQNESGELIFNKIITPRGGQYQVTLADGSNVWLNASSSLRFPVAFSGKQRRVELSGEAYFEIARDDSKPFKVSLPTMEVEVLGTHFNVMAYPEEETIETTLVEGLVNIHFTSKEHEAIRLNPGQQAQLDAAGKLRVVTDNATVDQAVAWRFGMFRFEDTDLKTIMRQLSRWYDVDVAYEEGIENVKFVGVVSRKANISSVLRVMEHTDAIHFEINPGLIQVKSGRKSEAD